MDDDLFNRLMEGVREAGAISRGEQAPTRITVYTPHERLVIYPSDEATIQEVIDYLLLDPQEGQE